MKKFKEWAKAKHEHEKLLEFHSYNIQEGVYDPHIFKAIFMAGGPGSGKSYFAKSVVGDKFNRYGLKLVDSDAIFEKMLKDANMEMTPENIFSKKGQEIRKQAKGMTGKRRENWIDGRLGLLIDGTGKNYDTIASLRNRLEAIGYDTYMVFVNTTLDVAQYRNANRERKLDKEEVEKMWTKVQSNTGKFSHLFGEYDPSRFQLVDNTVPNQDVVDSVTKEVRNFLQRDVVNPIAHKWIKDQYEDGAEQFPPSVPKHDRTNIWWNKTQMPPHMMKQVTPSTPKQPGLKQHKVADPWDQGDY
jgi:cytidylate kinase